jgi:hypothetical protein
MVRGDDQAAVQVEPVGIGPVEADARVEVELLAAQSLALLDQPVEQAPALPATPGLRQRREVIDVQLPDQTHRESRRGVCNQAVRVLRAGRSASLIAAASFSASCSCRVLIVTRIARSLCSR